jgi:putative transposase
LAFSFVDVRRRNARRRNAARKVSWLMFIKSYLGALAGGDSFTVEVRRGLGLVRYFVFFVIDIGTRRVHIAGISDSPSEAWMKQVTLELLLALRR